MILYTDASVVVALISGEDARALVDPILSEAADRVSVSDFAMAESSAALARLGRVERWSDAMASFLYGELDAWAALVAKPVSVTSDDVRAAQAIVRISGITLRAPDAIHIAAAQRLNMTILTLDHGMAKAAAALGVPHLNPAEADAPGEPKD